MRKVKVESDTLIRVASTTGHVVYVRPGEPKEIPEALLAEARRLGARELAKKEPPKPRSGGRGPSGS